MASDTVLLASDIKFLDPIGCGSTAGYSITKTIYSGKVDINALVALTDCNRKIEWEFNGDQSIEKINIAIKTLTEFKKELVKAKKLENK